MKFLPYFIYELLPYLYIALGVLATINLSNKLGLASGLLLLCVGLMVFWKRRAYRAEKRNGARILLGGQRSGV